MVRRDALNNGGIRVGCLVAFTRTVTMLMENIIKVGAGSTLSGQVAADIAAIIWLSTNADS